MINKKSKELADTPLSNSLHSSFIVHPASFARAFTLVELFLTIAVLMIVLGLMINLSNRVRGESADRLTRQMLQRLTVLMNNYINANGNVVPETTRLVDKPAPIESELQILARQNNLQFLRMLNLPQALQGKGVKSDELAHCFRKIGPNETVLADPWGSPIVFMPRQNQAIGMAPGDQPFFFSAGPDRLFLTREDNLYSYEEGEEK